MNKHPIPRLNPDDYRVANKPPSEATQQNPYAEQPAAPAVCWRTRDCSPEVQMYCQHAVTDYDMCPATCKFAICDRPEHVPTWDPKYVFEPNIDRDQALKHTCIHCEFFFINGPKRNEDAPKSFEEEDLP